MGSRRAQVARVNNQGCNFVLKSPDVGDEAYVGLRERDDKVTLWVPHGYPIDQTDDKPPVLDVREKHQILGELSRAVIRFSEAFHDKVQRSTRDGWLKADGGQSFNFDDPALGYTHLDRYYKLIRMLRDPRLLAVTKAPGLTAQFDHRYIARNLERAMFLADGTPVFDLSWAPRTQMRHTGNDMVGLACWMALDVLELLSAEQEVGTALQSEWEELAHRFADEHELDTDASLFSAKRKDTLLLLQAVLETCVRLSPPVSSDARELHHLLDELLHYALSGQDGDIWGLKGFHHVWESACLEYAIDNLEGADKVFTCDQTYLLGSAPTEWKENWSRIFEKNGLERRPDLVVEKGDGTYLIVDFKYYATDEAKKNFLSEPPCSPDMDLIGKNPKGFAKEWKLYKDIMSVEAYRWRLMLYELNSNDDSKVKIELWMPGSVDARHVCKWMDEPMLDDKAETQILSLVVKPVRKILGAYARKFQPMS